MPKIKKYKGLTRKPKLSAAAKEAETRNKRAKAASSTSSSKYKGIESRSASRVMTKAEKRSVFIETFTAKVVPQPPKTAKMDKGVSLRKLMRNTPKLMRENSFECVIVGFKRTKTPKGLPVARAKVWHRDPLRPNRTRVDHETMIIGLDDPSKPISKQNRVMVSCNCENFVFMWEYACAEHGAARIMYGNGEPPTITNPSHTPGLCKHAYAMATKLTTENI